MPDFPRPILDYWRKAFDGHGIEMQGGFALSVAPTLNRKRPAMMLERSDGRTQAAITPELADAIGDDEVGPLTAGGLLDRLVDEGVVLHDPDFLFYLPADARPKTSEVKFARQLTQADRAAFEAFQTAAPEQDREDAFVELDHWAVFGCFDGNRLVSAASAILWDESPVADLGVLTLPDARGKRYAHAVVQSINGFCREQGYEPQYRCQLDNHASVALAKACGLMLFGKWVVGTGGPDPSDG